MKRVTSSTKPEGMQPGKAPLPRGPMTPGEREQYKRGPYKRGPYKSPATQGRILGKALVGMSGREIARSEGVNRDTVKRILTQSEMHEAIIEGRRRFTELIPLALEVYRRTLKEAKGPYATSVAKDVLSGGQVSVPRTEALLESKEVESDRSTEDLFFKALHGHWPEEECHCGEAKKDGREPEPPKGKGVKV